MAWHRLENPDPSDISAEFKKRTRFLIDESLGFEVAAYLREKGFNAVYVGDAGLSGRTDEDIFAYAWRKKRMLLTHDRDFLDEIRFPEHRNPGVVVLPGGDGNQQSMGVGISTALAVFGAGPVIWEKTKSVVGSNGEMTIWRRNFDTGKVEATRYRLTRKGYAEIWGGE